MLLSTLNTPCCRGLCTPRWLAALVAMLALLSCRSSIHPGIVSLMDDIDTDLPAGPWRVLITQDALHGGSVPVGGDDRGTGTADNDRVFSCPVTLSGGGTLLVRLAYTKRWGEGGAVRARLLDIGSVVSSASQPLGRSWAELRVPAPALEQGWLQITHSGIEEPVPLRSVIALEIAESASPEDVTRAGTLAAWAARAQKAEDRVGLARRKAALVRDGSRRAVVALASGDTLTFDLPPMAMRMNLRFWLSGLRLMPEDTGVLSVEVGDEAGWETLATWEREDLNVIAWRRTDMGPWITPGVRQLRFVLGGRDEVVAIGSPILIPEHSERTPRKNVILIDLDTMRADRLGSYGYSERPTSVRLDSLLDARGFTVFRRAYSAGPWTLPSTAKFLISRYRNIDRNETVPREYTTLAEMLRWEGYYCVAFTGGGVLRFPGFEQGFHRYFWSEELGDNLGKVESVFPRATRWLRAIDLAPFFLFVHTYEPHEPYTRDVFCRDLPHGRLGNVSDGEPLIPEALFGKERAARLTPQESLYVQAAYDGGVKVACDATADLLAILDERDLWENTVVVILSDHGEEFWEHSGFFADHRPTSIYGELIDVPFLLHSPGYASRGRRFIETEVSLVDLLPTIADLTGVRPLDDADGTSLAPLLRGAPINRHLPIMALTQPGDPSLPIRGAVIEDGRKYHEAVTLDSGRDYYYPVHAQLYDLGRDPGETNNLVAEAPDAGRELAERLRRGLGAATAPLAVAPDGSTAMSGELRGQLRALGYLGE